jgi:L1 cell adhesion molecule like protein
MAFCLFLPRTKKNASNEKKITINQQKGRLSDNEIKKILEEAEKYKAEDEEIKKKVQAKNDLENYSYQMRNTIEDPKFKDIIKEDDRKKVEKIIKDTTTWLEANPNAETDEYEAKRKEIEQVWTPIITAAYGAQGGAGGGMPGMGGMPNFGGAPGGGGHGGAEAGPKIDEVD